MYKCMHCGKEYAFPLDSGVCPNGCDSRRLKEIYPWLFKRNNSERNNSERKDKAGGTEWE